MSAPARREPATGGRQADRAALDELCRQLSREDPVTAQQALCEVLRGFESGGEADLSLDGMLVLDRMARHVCEQLIDLYVEGDAQLRLFGRRSYVSALRLAQAMAAACERLLRSLDEPTAAARADDVAQIVVRLLFFREIEILLRMFRYKKRNANEWHATHEAYRFAFERDLHGRVVAIDSPGSKNAVPTTAGQQYLQVLLLESVNGGQLAPREMLWTRRWLAGWCQLLTLMREGVGASTTGERPPFAVDLRGTEGLTRKETPPNESVLYLDTAPLAKAIDESLLAERDPDCANVTAGADRDARMALLRKLRLHFAPVPVRIERRGQRLPASSVVNVIAGLPDIVRTLRPADTKRPDASVDDATIGAFYTATQSMMGALASPERWQVRDRSDSGCRLRGQTTSLDRAIPGTLVAMRASDSDPWSLAIVRRLRRLMVDHVEIGVESIGHNPRFVKIVVHRGPVTTNGTSGAVDARCFSALYLPPSESGPALPIRTLLMPAREYRHGGGVTLLSSNATYTLLLNEPIEAQQEFVWTSFSIVAKASAGQPDP